MALINCRGQIVNFVRSAKANADMSGIVAARRPKFKEDMTKVLEAKAREIEQARIRMNKLLAQARELL